MALLGQYQPEFGAPAFLALHFQAAAVPLHHGVHQRQSQAHARDVGVALVVQAGKGGKQAVLLAWVNAGAFIAHRDHPVRAAKKQRRIQA